MTQEDRNTSGKLLREPKVAAAIGVGLAAVIIAVLLIAGGDDDNGDSGSAGARGPEEVSVDELRDLPNEVGHSVYWAGERPDTKYELTVTEDGNVFIRYLEPDVEIGTSEVVSLTIGTYPVPDARGALEGVAEAPEARTGETPDGAFVVAASPEATSVYLAPEGSAEQQIEVYDPDPKAAFALATSGAVVPIP